MAERVFLHVGTPKSGNTYLQGVLWQNAAALRAHRCLLPGRFKTQFAAAKGVANRVGVKRELELDPDAWPRLAKHIRRWDGDAVVSHELLAPATNDQARRAKRALGGAEVHIVITARALAKQLVDLWREQVKRGMPTPIDLFLRRVRDGEAVGEWFWDVQDVGAIAQRWGVDVAPEHVHIVTVAAGPPDDAELWRRFAGALDLDHTQYDAELADTSSTLGPVECELLRLLHTVHDDRFTDSHRHVWTRKLLAGEILGRRSSTPLQLPDGTREWADERTAAIEREIVAQGYDVVGDLADLHWQEPPTAARTTASVSQDELDDAMEWTIGRLQEVLVERQSPIPPPPVGPDDGLVGILELLEHIRAADTGRAPREMTVRRTSTSDRLRKSITALRGR